jgi:hypothetical protein
MKRKKSQKPYWEMNADELAEATREFDRPVPLSKTSPLTPQERAEFERMRRSPHRSVFVSRDANGVFVRLDPELLRRSAEYANARKVSLSDLISRSLKGMLAMVEEPELPRRRNGKRKAG